MSTTRLSLTQDIPRLKQIWKKCFQDPDAFIDFYFAQFHEPDQSMVLLVDGEIASMLTMIPLTLQLRTDCTVPCVMLYAIATDPAYQGKGLARELMEAANAYAAQRNIAYSLLVPASPSLFSFYEKSCYEAGFPVFESTYFAKDAPAFSFEQNSRCAFLPLSAEHYNALRDELCASNAYIKYPAASVLFQKRLSALSGADLYAIEFNNIRGCAAVERLGKQKLFIKELLWPSSDSNPVLDGIASLFFAQEIFLRSPLFLPAPPLAVSRPLAMIKPIQPSSVLPCSIANIQKNETYLGLAFD